MLGLTQFQTYLVVAGLAVVLVGGAFYWTLAKGEKMGSAAVTKAVQGETIRTMDKARQEKAVVDERVRNKPLDELVDGLK